MKQPNDVFDALQVIVDICEGKASGGDSKIFTIYNIARNALSAPRRNCDEPIDNQYNNFRKFCRQYDEDCRNCPLRDDDECYEVEECALRWAQLTQKKQEVKDED